MDLSCIIPAGNTNESIICTVKWIPCVEDNLRLCLPNLENIHISVWNHSKSIVKRCFKMFYSTLSSVCDPNILQYRLWYLLWVSKPVVSVLMWATGCCLRQTVKWQHRRCMMYREEVKRDMVSPFSPPRLTKAVFLSIMCRNSHVDWLLTALSVFKHGLIVLPLNWDVARDKPKMYLCKCDNITLGGLSFLLGSLKM